MSVSFSWSNTWRFSAPEPKSAREIMSEVAKTHGYKLADLIAMNRSARVSRVRHEAVWTCRQVRLPDGSPRYSLTFLGNILGHRDHTTMLNSERKWEEILRGCGPQSSRRMADRVARLERLLAHASAA